MMVAGGVRGLHGNAETVRLIPSAGIQTWFVTAWAARYAAAAASSASAFRAAIAALIAVSCAAATAFRDAPDQMPPRATDDSPAPGSVLAEPNGSSAAPPTVVPPAVVVIRSGTRCPGVVSVEVATGEAA